MLIALFFTNYGPYHLARLEACQILFKQFGWDVIGLEISRTDALYAWQTDIKDFPVQIISILPDHTYKKLKLHQIFNKFNQTLSQLKPDVLAIAGYAEPAMLSALLWSLLHKKPTILLSDSKEDDAKRVWIQELLKSFLLKSYKAAFVAGQPHKRYLIKLGIPSNSIFLGYDVVDNKSFAPDKLQHLPNHVEKPYFLAINRFVPKKNIPLLISAYANYREKTGPNAWILVLCGDGEQRLLIEKQISELNLQDSVHLPGFLQQEQLLPYFAHASCFVHAGIREQWGLVVNEAMAVGLPVLVSNCCGCFEDLVIESINGFGFSPDNTQELTNLMLKMSSGDIDLKKMGQASLQHIQNFSPEHFAQSLMEAVKYALAH